MAPHLNRVDLRTANILPMVENLAFDSGAWDQVIHAVDAAQHGALAAPGWPDERRDLVFRHVEGDAGDRQEVAIEDLQIAERHERTRVVHPTLDR